MNVEKLSPVLKSICVASNGAFVGASLYVLSVEFPSFDEHSYGCVLKILRLKLRHHRRLAMGLTVATGLSGVSLYLIDKDKNLPYLVAGSMMLLAIPLGILAIGPTINPLVKPSAKDDMQESEVREKIKKLRWLASVRFIASLSTFGYLVYHLTA